MSLTLTRGSDAHDPYTGTTVGTHIRRRKPLYVDGTEVQSDLVEGARTNYHWQSENLEATGWTATRVGSVAGSAITNKGIRLQRVNDTNAVGVRSFRRTASTTALLANDYVVCSCYVKATSGTAMYPRIEFRPTTLGTPNIFSVFNLQVGDWVGSLTQPTAVFVNGSYTRGFEYLGDGIYRIWISAQAIAGMDLLFPIGMNYTAVNSRESYTSTGGNGFYCGGFQIEKAAFPSTYIKTLASTVTRAADSTTYTGVWDMTNEGTMCLAIVPYGWTGSFGGAQPRFLYRSDDASNYRSLSFSISETFDIETNRGEGGDSGDVCVTASSGDAYPTLSRGNLNIVSMTWFDDAGAKTIEQFKTNGTSAGTNTDAAVTFFDNPVQLSFDFAGSEPFSHIAAFYWQRRLSNAEIFAFHNALTLTP